jgi:hypothetical protein
MYVIIRTAVRFAAVPRPRTHAHVGTETSDSDVCRGAKKNRSVMTPPKNLGRTTDWLGAIRTKTFFCPRSLSGARRMQKMLYLYVVL